MNTHDVENRAYRHQWEWTAPRSSKREYGWKFLGAYRIASDQRVEYGVKIANAQVTVAWLHKKPKME